MKILSNLKLGYKSFWKTLLDNYNNRKFVFLFFIIIFFILFLTQFTSFRYTSLSSYKFSIDPGWIYGVENIRSDESQGILGDTVSFTYGPLSSFLLQYSNDVNHPILHNLISSTFLIFIFSIILILLYLNLKESKNYILFLILPFLFWFIRFENYESLIFVLMFLFALFFNTRKVNIPIVLFFSFLSSIFILFKFSLGIYLLLFFNLLIFVNLFSNKKELIKRLILINGLFFLSTSVLYIFLTHNINIFSFFYDSLLIMINYKEFMAYTFLSNAQLLGSWLLIPAIILPLYYLKKKIYIPYLFLTYAALLYGYVRNDGHVIETNTFLFFIATISLIKFITVNNENKNFKSIYKLFLIILSLFIIIISIFQYKNFNINLLGLNLNAYAIINPVFDKEINKVLYEKDITNVKNYFTQDMKNDIGSSKSLIVLPWATYLPSVFNVKQIQIPSLQSYVMYSEYFDNKLTETLSKNYKNSNLLLHSGALDNRFYLSENPKSALFIIKNYDIQASQLDAMLLKAKNETLQNINCSETKDISEANFFKINLEINFLKKLKSMIYKPDELCMKYQTEDNKTYINRIYETQLKNGIIINPLLRDIDDLNRYYLNNSTKISSYKIITCNDEKEIKIKNENMYKCN